MYTHTHTHTCAHTHTRGFPGGSAGKEPARQCRRLRRLRFNIWIGKISWRRKWQPAPVFLPGKFHGQRSLAGYSPWGCKESDTTERLGTISFWLLYSTGSCQTIKSLYNRTFDKALQGHFYLLNPSSSLPLINQKTS